MKKLFRSAIVLIMFLSLAFGAYASTRALQFKVFAFGITNPDTGASLDSGVVYFYAAGSGTSTPKNVWTEKAKSNAFTSVTLDSDGSGLWYGEGEYHILVKDSSANTVYDRDYFRMEYPNFYQHTVASDYTQTADDDVIFVNTAGGNKEITLLAAASWKWPLTIMNTSTNTVTITPDGSELIDGASSATITTINTAYVLVSTGTAITSMGSTPSSQYMADLGVNFTYSALINYSVGDFAVGSDDNNYITLIANGPVEGLVDPVGDATATWGFADSQITDSDGDTYVTVEDTADEDKIQFYLSDVKKGTVDTSGIISNTKRVITGSTDATPVALRASQLFIENGASGVSVKCTLSSVYNGDVLAVTDSIEKNETDNNFFLSASGETIIIREEGLTGAALGVIGVNLLTDTESDLEALVYMSGNDIYFILNASGVSDTTLDITTLVDTGNIYIYFTYLTNL